MPKKMPKKMPKHTDKEKVEIEFGNPIAVMTGGKSPRSASKSPRTVSMANPIADEDSAGEANEAGSSGQMQLEMEWKPGYAHTHNIVVRVMELAGVKVTMTDLSLGKHLVYVAVILDGQVEKTQRVKLDVDMDDPGCVRPPAASRCRISSPSFLRCSASSLPCPRRRCCCASPPCGH